MFCDSCNDFFTKIGYSKHIKSKNHLVKAGETSKCENFLKNIVKLHIRKQSQM